MKKLCVAPIFCNHDIVIPKSPKEFTFRKSSNKIAYELNRLWHSRLPIMNNWMTCAPCYVAIFEGYFFASAMWGQPVAANRFDNGHLMLELRRMAIADYAPYNTATRMLAFMRKDIKERYPHICRLISYQDTEVHSGTIYKADNWTLAHTMENYTSWKNRPGRIDQVKSKKSRWEYTIKDFPENDNVQINEQIFDEQMELEL